jgi:hypothetical protein
MNDNPYFDYNIDSLSFIERAKMQLAKFDNEENISCLLYAALELRMGIESRLYEIIDGHPEEDTSKLKLNKKFAASNLLKDLLSINPDADRESMISLSINVNQQTFHRFTPVTKKLGSLHGKLGDMLHFNLFRDTPEWYGKKPNEDGKKYTLIQYRELLDEVVEELFQCSCGDLLLPVKFNSINKQT